MLFAMKEAKAKAVKESVPPLPAESPGQTEASPEFDSGRKGCDTKVFDNKYPETEQLRNDMYDKLIFRGGIC